MLSLKNITKIYRSGDGEVRALRDLSVDFRDHEFVSVLGQSGCGKTTLLNIIGGLDRYTSGDLVIHSKSTRDFKDRDWDNYRNHSVGFVFQSYNLIPHQSALSNVELALTLSGVSRAERRRKAIEALEKVGLSDQLNKRPSQMSGGQAQRVAIARAIVNDPEIILADEPTGALDTETSVQVMEILRKIADDRLVIMVTHNPDLAEKYSDRIIRLLDGALVGDTDPYTEPAPDPTPKKAPKKPSMSFFTALSLSFNNLLTKKGRTFLTSFAGSIGIIGIALVASITAGVNAYIDRVQEDALTSYPIEILEENVDMSALIGALTGADDPEAAEKHELDAVYSNPVTHKLVNSLNSMETTKNNLTRFKKHLDSSGKFDPYVMSVEYSYDTKLNVYTRDPDGKIFESDVSSMIARLYGFESSSMYTGTGFAMGGAMSAFRSYDVWEQLLSGRDGKLISEVLEEQYTVLAGSWSVEDTDLVLVVNERNEISDFVLYALGLKTYDQMKSELDAASRGEQIDASSQRWTYDEIMGKEFRVVISADKFSFDPVTGAYTDLSATENGAQLMFNSPNAIKLKICGVIKKNSDAVAGMIKGSIGYTSALSQRLIALTADRKIVKDQLADPAFDAILSLPFRSAVKEPDESEKLAAAREFIASGDAARRAEIFKELSSVIPPQMLEAQVKAFLDSNSREDIQRLIVEAYAQRVGGGDVSAVESAVASMSDEDFAAAARELVSASVSASYREQALNSLASLDDAALSTMLSQKQLTDAELLTVYEDFVPSGVSDSTYEENLGLLGYADADSPSSVRIYCSTFADKEKVEELIKEYNASAEETDRISYTDIVAIMMKSVSTIINAISYVLMAFVSVSLVVSSIMIGIITYISVLERTKEIGVLRAIGASKGDVSRVFNAETFIVGLLAGAIGILVTLLLLVPINAVIHALAGISSLNAVLPWTTGVALVLLSLFLTVLAGFVPSRLAAKKDPVVALRTE